MNIGDLVGFKKELFFEGAVQLRWYQENVERAKIAAENFVFHGPRYHGVSEDDDRGVSRAYKLKDTATFVHDLLASLHISKSNESINPLLLAVAGYGSGKSHFALTAAQLLSHPNSPESFPILKNIYSADAKIGDKVFHLLEKISKPALVVTLDGMSNFHLGSELSRGIIRQLKSAAVDLGAIMDLSPRFKYAEDFVSRNYELRKVEFDKVGLSEPLSMIVEKLQEQDEKTYSIVDEIFYKANGTRIPVDGHESAQDLIRTVCDVYCGEQGVFSNLVILFDEFGRYLEYAAEKPNLAGDSALQQIFQGIQDSNSKARFVGFIQYELKAYLNRFNQRDLLQLQRYITRFDSSEKLYLSTNLETLFAHLIEKRNETEINHVLECNAPKDGWKDIHGLLSACLPGFKRIPVWADFEKFKQVVVEGCWPLHPMTTWFLTRQQDIVQSRSALTFIKNAIDNVSTVPHLVDGVLFYISPAELVLQSMLPEIIAAERAQGGSIAETLQALLEKYKSKFSPDERRLLAGVMILDKLRIEIREKTLIDKILGFVAGLSENSLEKNLLSLSREIGVVEWNADLGQYELITDAATRGQFQMLLQSKIQKIDEKKISEIFIHRGSNYAELSDLNPDFGQKNNISTVDWFYRASLSDSRNISHVLQHAIENWNKAFSYDDPKGQVVYALIQEHENFNAAIEIISETYKRNFGEQKAPIWTILLHDNDGSICENLAKVYVLDETFTHDECEKFRRFIPEERSRSLRMLSEAVNKAQRERYFIVAGFDDVPDLRVLPFATWLFEQVYTQVISFPFDGFSTKTGSGSRDCMDLVRALVSRQVNGDWVALQKKALQNRVTQLLVKEWKILGKDGQLRKKPGCDALADLLFLFEDIHLDDAERTLGETFRQLLLPPYGFNSSSAGVVLGLLLAKEMPPKALKYSGESCSLEEWLVQVLPNTRGKNSFDIKGLDKTNLLFLEENAEQRWNARLLNLDNEKRYAQIILLFKEAEKQKKADPLPQNLVGHYAYIRDKAQEAEAKFGTHCKEVEEIEIGLERAERNQNVNSIIYCGSKIAQKVILMKSNCELWDENQIDELESLVTHVKHLLSGRINNWIIEQSCNNIMGVSDYRGKMEKNIKDLERIGLSEEANLLDNHKNRVISQVELRAESEMSLIKAADIVRLPEPTLKERVLSIRQNIQEIDDLVSSLIKANRNIDAKDISTLIDKLKSRKENFENIEQQHKNLLEEVYNLQIEDLRNVENLIVRVRDLQYIFSGTIDENDVIEVFDQLKIIEEDMKRWDLLNIPHEELEAFLNEQVPQRVQVIKERIEEEGSELFFDITSIYFNFKEKLLHKLKQQSIQWTNDVIPNIEEIRSWSVLDCERRLVRLNTVPDWISLCDRQKIVSCTEIIQTQIDDLIEIEREKKAAEWLDMMRREVDAIKTKNVIYCQKLISDLNSIPKFIKNKDYEEISTMRKVVQSYVDEIHIDDILERICNLSERLRTSLIGQLRKKFSEIF